MLTSVQPHPTPPVPRLDKLTRPKTGLSRLGLVFLRHILGRVFPIGQRVALSDQPAVQVRAIRGVANTERPQVAIPALYRAGDRVRADPCPEHLGGVFPTLVGATRLPAGLTGLGGVNALEPHLLPRHFKRVAVNDPGHAAQDLNGDFAAAVLRRLGQASGRLPVLAHAGGLPFLMTMPCACDLAPLGTIGPARVTPVSRPAAWVGCTRPGCKDSQDEYSQDAHSSPAGEEFLHIRVRHAPHHSPLADATAQIRHYCRISRSPLRHLLGCTRQ